MLVHREDSIIRHDKTATKQTDNVVNTAQIAQTEEQNR